MALEPIVVFGDSAHARVVLDAIEKQGLYRPVGLLARAGGPSVVAGCRVLGSEDEVLPGLAGQIAGGVIAVGDNYLRWRIARRVEELIPGFPFLSVMHPGALIGSRVTIGPGATVLAGAVVNPDCWLGAHSIVNTGASLDHDSVLGDFASIAPGAVTGGYAAIGEGSAICLGAAISHRVRIGQHTVVGAGAVVLRSLPEKVVAYGVPARIVRRRQPGESYLHVLDGQS